MNNFFECVLVLQSWLDSNLSKSKMLFQFLRLFVPQTVVSHSVIPPAQKIALNSSDESQNLYCCKVDVHFSSPLEELECTAGTF